MANTDKIRKINKEYASLINDVSGNGKIFEELIYDKDIIKKLREKSNIVIPKITGDVNLFQSQIIRMYDNVNSSILRSINPGSGSLTIIVSKYIAKDSGSERGEYTFKPSNSLTACTYSFSLSRQKELTSSYILIICD